MNPVRNHVLKNPISSGLLSLKTMKNFPKISNGVKNTKILVVFFCLTFLIVVFATKGFGLFGSDEIKPGLDEGSFISTPLSEVSENAKWYEYDLGNKTVKFFVIKAKDGSIKTAFDACDICYYSGKGYRQEGDYMVCNNCGNRYPISGLGTENKMPGGCWPGYLPHIIEGDYILIEEKDLIDNSWRTL